MGILKQQTFSFSKRSKPEVQSQGVDRVLLFAEPGSEEPSWTFPASGGLRRFLACGSIIAFLNKVTL